jgi:hypothetical protein
MRIEVTSARSRSSSLRNAGYQKPHSKSDSMLDAVNPGMEMVWLIVPRNSREIRIHNIPITLQNNAAILSWTPLLSRASYVR